MYHVLASDCLECLPWIRVGVCWIVSLGLFGLCVMDLFWSVLEYLGVLDGLECILDRLECI